MPTEHPSHTKTIGESTYHVRELGFLAGRRAFVRLSHMLGPALSRMEAVSKAGESAEDRIAAIILTGLGGLLSSMSDDDLQALTGEFAVVTDVDLPDGKTVRLDRILELHFRGGALADWFEWLAFCVEVTYGPFFVRARDKLGETLRANRTGNSTAKSE